jgi:competence protein ComEC
MMGIGALIYFWLPAEPGWIWLTVALALVSAGLWLARHGVVMKAALAAILFLLAGTSAGKIETWRAQTQMNGSEVVTRVTGRVLRMEHQATGRIRLTLDVLATERPQLRHAPDRIRLSARGVPDEARPGSVVTGLGQLMPLSGPVRPGSYDLSFNSYHDGIGAVGFFFRDPCRRGAHARGGGALCATRCSDGRAGGTSITPR